MLFMSTLSQNTIPCGKSSKQNVPNALAITFVSSVKAPAAPTGEAKITCINEIYDTHKLFDNQEAKLILQQHLI